MTIQAATMDTLYRRALDRVLVEGDLVSPRGQETWELRGVTLELTAPDLNLLSSPARKLNYSFAVAEWLWHRMGETDAAAIGAFNSNIGYWANDLGSFDGAYGPKLVGQLPYVVETLREDPDSRRAVLTIWRERPRTTKDYPCTVLFHFMIRHGKLELVVYMRSNDVWLGLPYDLFNFTQIQRQVADALGVDLGPYRHVVGSLHLYIGGPVAPDLERVDAVVAEKLTVPHLAPAPTWEVPTSVRRVFWAVVDGANPVDEGLLEDIPWAWRPYADMMAYRVLKRPELLSEPFHNLVQETR